MWGDSRETRIGPLKCWICGEETYSYIVPIDKDRKTLGQSTTFKKMEKSIMMQGPILKYLLHWRNDKLM
jgi:hypothetical protein